MEWKVIQAIRQQAAADRIELESEGLARFIGNQRAVGLPGFHAHDPARLERALRMKLDQVDVLDRVWGGGPLEAFYRLITQMNLTSELDSSETPSLSTRLIQGTDLFLMHFMQTLMQVLPDFLRFNDTQYLASGYNISGSRMGQHVAATLAFSFVAFVAGFYALKYREVAA